MKLIILIILTCLLFSGNAIADIDIPPNIIFDVMYPLEVNDIIGGWEIKGMHFSSILKKNIDADTCEIWNYNEIDTDRRIGFDYHAIGWNNGEIFGNGVFPTTATINRSMPIKIIYNNIIKNDEDANNGINVQIIQDNFRLQKLVEIESIESFDRIPDNAEFLEISFIITGDLVIDDMMIDKPFLIANNSYIQPIRVWDTDGNICNESSLIITDNIITKCIPREWLINAVYPVKTDISITYGMENVFNSATTNYISVAALDSTHFVVGYSDFGNSNYGTAIVGSVSGTTITGYGSENVFNSATTNYISVAALDSTHFVIGYMDNGNSNYGTAIVGSVSGTTITGYGSENVFNSANTDFISVAALDSTRFVVGYRDTGNSNYGTAIVGSVSGTTITGYGAENVFNSVTTYYISVAALDSTHFVIGYMDTGNSNYGTAIVGTVSGTTITGYGSENVFNSGTTFYISVAALDSTHFVVGYRDRGNSDHGTAIVGSVSGTTITGYGSENVFNSATTYCISVAALDSTHFVVGYRDWGNSNYGTAIVGTVSGTTITGYGSENVFNSATTYYISVAALDSTHFVVGYRDWGNSNYGTAIIGKILLPIIPTNIFLNIINIIKGFPAAIGGILSSFLSFLPMFVGILISGALVLVCVGVFEKFKRW